MSHTGFELKRSLFLMFFSTKLVVFWGRVCYLLQPHSWSSSAWPLACGNQLSPKHWQSVCKLPLHPAPNPSPILTLIAVDHVAKLAHIVFIDLHLLAFHKCRYSSLNLGSHRRNDRDNKIQRIDELLIGVKKAMRFFFRLLNANNLQTACSNLHYMEWEL